MKKLSSIYIIIIKPFKLAIHQLFDPLIYVTNLFQIPKFERENPMRKIVSYRYFVTFKLQYIPF